MPPLSLASRPIMWNISQVWVMYVMFIAAVAVFGWGMYRRILFWRNGTADQERFADWAKRFGILIRETFLQKQVRNSAFPGLFHALIFYSFGVLFVTTLIIMVEYDAKQFFDLTLQIFKGYTYVFFTIGSELGGVLILVGVAMAAWRRYVRKPDTLPNTVGNGLVLLFLVGLVLTGYLTEGLRIAVLGDPWRALTPVGWASGALFRGVSPEGGRVIHAWLWWIHTVFAMGWIALIPFSKLVHLVWLPTNVFFSKLRPRGELRRPDLEKLMEAAEGDAELRLGIQKPEELSWKQRLDGDACVSCGRCDELCPAYLVNKRDFAPRKLIERISQTVTDAGSLPAGASDAARAEDIVGHAFDQEFVWHCRTCAACTEICPALIEHVDTLMEIRRNEVLIQGRMPSEAARALKTYEIHGNPFGPQSDRTDAVKKLGFRVVGAGEKCDALYWIGCGVTFDPQKHRIAQDLGRLMEKCGIDFGVLGADEKCCGDPARVMGQEMLFQQTAKEQVELLKSRQFRFVITSCPHCLNVLKHEYRQFGGNFEIVHHSVFLREMLRTGKLAPKISSKRNCVYHDPCYLGRYQGIYDAPRDVIRAIPGIRLGEMKSHREKSLCCGAGGGHYWMDLKEDERVNNLRVKQAHAAGADTIVTGCSFCLHMLEDSVKLQNLEDRIRVKDLGSLLSESLEGQPPA